MQQQQRDETQLAREKALFRYSSALDRGDFDIVADVLDEANNDPILEHMILEVNATYTLAMETSAEADAANVVRNLLREHLPSGFLATAELAEPPLLTVGDVVARLQADTTASGKADGEVSAVSHRLRESQVALPAKLSQNSIRRLFENLGIDVSKRIQKLFRDTAIFLSMGREQGMIRLAATRRQERLREEIVDETQSDEDISQP